MNATLKKMIPALAILTLILSWAAAYGTAVRLKGKSHRREIAAITAEHDRSLSELRIVCGEVERLEAELADSRKRHRIACKSIERFSEELAYADAINKDLKWQVEHCPYHNFPPPPSSDQ